MKSTENNLKVLVVDDDIQSRNLIMEIFKPFSFDFVTAENGHDGLLKFKEWQPSIVITDLQMPKMNGLEFIESIRELGSMVPVIAVSGAAPMLTEALSLGANSALEKPFSIEDIIESLKKHL